jgi:hypothetical protein
MLLPCPLLSFIERMFCSSAVVISPRFFESNMCSQSQSFTFWPNIKTSSRSALRSAHIFAGDDGGLEFLSNVTAQWGSGGLDFDDLEIYDGGVSVLMHAGVCGGAVVLW